MFNLLHTYLPQPILFQIGFLKIHWYGFLIAIGALLGIIVVLHLAKQYNLKREEAYNFLFYLIIFGLIGDRLYYIIYAWSYYSQNLLDIFKIWQGGMAIHGAIIAGVLVMYFFGKKYKINPWLLADISIVGFALAMSIGRWGNYFNQELYGLPTNLPWGIPISPDHRAAQFVGFSYFHPTFLYESLWDFFLFFLFYLINKVQISVKKNNPKVKLDYGYIALAYFILYSIGRFFNEFLRIDFSPYIFGIRTAQVASLSIILISLAVIVFRLYKKIVPKNFR
ncbi:MAG: prolipoprotein diacylglyceryl transferase [Patescibacteria group bacterium]|nr:prolipoprotein diacylglyceryl transferase [Patescibacteria group bacterium]